LRDPQRQFGPIRVWGTIGWIFAGLVLSFLRRSFGSENWAVIDVFVLAGVFSILMGLISFALPHTPPAKEAPDPLAFREALVLLKDRNYFTFFVIAFIVATELRLYYILTFPFLQTAGTVVGITEKTLPAWMTIAQIAEIFTITFLLPYALPRWGVRNSLLIGIVAWPIRYLVFAFTWATYQTMPWTVWLSIAALALHGFCYVFFFVVAFIYTDMVAPKDIRSSAQALINVAVLGLGLLIGGFFAGWLRDFFTSGGTTNYTMVFSIPAIITFLCAIAFAALFREERARAT
jgi:MFS family permease